MPEAKILVVDDDPDFVEVTRTVLEKANYRVVSASNGDEALKKIKATKPDLVLLDVMMATVTEGISVTEQLKQDPMLRHLPIVIVSSIADTPHAGLVSMDEAIHTEAWLSKPVTSKQLLDTVRRVLGE